MDKDNIDEKYLIPKGYISCPGCGRRYGHHNTKVDINTEECSSCVKKFDNDEEAEFVSAQFFIEEILQY